MRRSRERRCEIAFALLLGLLFAVGCDGAAGSTSAPSSPFDTREVVPASSPEVLVRFPEGPAHIATQTSNNNLDVAEFRGRTFLAWRTAPTHFASSATEILVASEGPDGFRLEGRFARGTDLREPRLLALGDRLLLYFAVLGTDPLAFEPKGTMVTEYRAPETWDAPELLPLGNFIPWRARAFGDKAIVAGYDGGENIYNFDGKPLRVRLLETTDGRTFAPAVPEAPVAITGGASETDFAFLDDGALVTVSRNEAGDAVHGFGSIVCRAEASSLGSLRCRSDRRKYDSPLLFREGADLWLVGRRNVTPSGDYDLGLDFLPLEDRAGAYEGAYSATPKRCALWRVDPDSLEVTWVQDLPSRGDTCFPAMTQGQGHHVTVYNYTNELEDALDCPSWPDQCTDLPWAAGQLLPTEIYRVDLALP
jgi:hypothetical protein